MKRKLADLYRRETTLTLDDGRGDPVTVIIRKMSPVQYEMAYRKANGIRATILTINGEESDYYQSTRNEIIDMERDDLIEYLSSAQTAKNVAVIEAEVAGTDKWTKDEYLIGLMDAWDGGLSDKYTIEPEDEEAKAVFEKLKEYKEEVETAIVAHAETQRQGFNLQSNEDLEQQAIKDMLKLNADMVWMEEFKKWEIFYSVLDPDTEKRMFDSRAEVDGLAPQILNEISSAIDKLVVDATEGKDSSLPDSSSDSSEQPPTEAMVDVSGPAVANE